MSANFLKSPLRYPGGKSRAIKTLAPFFPREFSEFREPFFGGGSVGLFLAQTRRLKRVLANDLNYDLFCFWQVLKTRENELIAEISRVKNAHKNGRELYEMLLLRRGENLSEFERAVDFFVLNRITFSGVVDCGGYSQKAFESRFTQSSIERLRGLDGVLADFEFSCAGYENLLRKGGEGVFIFLDPPYFSASKSRLYGKKGDLHAGFEHERLRDELRGTAHHFLLTYDDSEFIRALYADFFVREFSVQYGMNNFKQNHAQRGRELLISNREFAKENTLFIA